MLKVLELFGGIGACSKALERLGINYEIADYVEIDKYAVASFNAMHNTNFEPQDICKWDKDIDVDLVMHGSPCQDFSLAGLQAGGDEGSGTRSSLMYETVRIVEKLKPKYVIWENVKNMISKKHIHNLNNYLEKMNEIGYTSFYQVLNAKDYGIPQNRERVFTISIRNDIDIDFVFPEKQELSSTISDFEEYEIDDRFIVKKALNIKNTKNYIQWSNSGKMQNSQAERAYYENGLAPTISSSNTNGDKTQIVTCYKEYTNFYTIPRGSDNKLINGSYNRVWKKDKYVGTINLTKITEIGQLTEKGLIIRKLTPKECWRLMGFDDSDFEKAEKVNSNTQLYKQAGNSIVVNVLEAILDNLLINNKENKFSDLD